MNRKSKTLLILALVAVVALAFRVSWNALRDVARAIGADSTAAVLYPFVVDGLMALALVATLVLTDEDDKRRALKVLGTYTGASLVLNYVHGLVPNLHDASIGWSRLADWDIANWALVLLATSLPVGSIYFGSDLVAKVIHHQPPASTNAEKSTETERNRSTLDQQESTPEPAAPPDPDTCSGRYAGRSRQARSGPHGATGGGGGQVDSIAPGHRPRADGGPIAQAQAHAR